MSVVEALDLAGPLRTAILSNAEVTALLGVWEGEPAIFTRRPVPTDAPYPLIAIGPDISIGNMDGLTMRLPMPRRDILVYGQQPDDYRTVEALGYLLRAQFHRQRFSVDLSPAYSVIDIVCTGPMEAPVSDDSLVGRALLLQLRLKEVAT